MQGIRTNAPSFEPNRQGFREEHVCGFTHSVRFPGIVSSVLAIIEIPRIVEFLSGVSMAFQWDITIRASCLTLKTGTSRLVRRKWLKWLEANRSSTKPLHIYGQQIPIWGNFGDYANGIPTLGFSLEVCAHETLTSWEGRWGFSRRVMLGNLELWYRLLGPWSLHCWSEYWVWYKRDDLLGSNPNRGCRPEVEGEPSVQWYGALLTQWNRSRIALWRYLGRGGEEVCGGPRMLNGGRFAHQAHPHRFPLWRLFMNN